MFVRVSESIYPKQHIEEKTKTVTSDLSCKMLTSQNSFLLKKTLECLLPLQLKLHL